ncbi:MAG: DUF4249 domain-containing protein [Bacteroidia bacterium]
MKNIIFITIGFFSILTACNLEKEIDIDLPDYESRPVVECYLEPGQPFALSLSRSASYFDTFPSLDFSFLQKVLISNAQVTISHNGKTYELKNQFFLNPTTQKVYNYFNSEFVPTNFDQKFDLKITLADGETIEATTRLLQKIQIDSIVVQFEKDDTLARVLTYLTDVPNQANYYRRMLHESSLDSIANQDFIFDDRIVEDALVFGTAYDFAAGDTVISTIFHINKDYYNFLESVFNARDSNGNPFGSPNPIISNVRGTAGAIGIFTGVSYDREIVIVKR